MAEALAKVLKENKIEYVIVGALAVCSWGNVRTTRNVDVILSLKAQSIKKLVNALKKKDFWVNEEDIKDALGEKSHFTIFDNLSEYHIDATGVYNENHLQTLKNRKKIKIDGIMCYIASAEDTIASKLLFGSEQDIKDAEGIYVRQHGKLNLDYLKNRCRKLNVHDDFLALKERVEKIENELSSHRKNY